MQLLIGGQWTAAQSGRVQEVTSPFDGAVAGSVPMAGIADVDAALTSAVAGAKVWRNTPGHERMRILLQAATLANWSGNVDDEASVVLMREFYRARLVAGQDNGEALRRAQIATRARLRSRDPFYWAGFVLTSSAP